MKYQINYENNLRCSLTHEGSGNELKTDAPKDNNGKGETFSPTDLTAVSLASCMLTVIAIYLKKNGYSEPRVSGSAEKKMSNSPRRIQSIEVNLLIELNETDSSEEMKSAIRNVAKTCPVALSLHPETSQILTIEFKTYSA